MELAHEALERTRRELEDTGEEARRVAEDLSPEALWWRPARDRWSVGECLEHLVKTNEAYLEVLDEAIERGREEGLVTDGPVKRTLMGRWLAHVLEPPARLKLPAPSSILPRGEEPAPEVSPDGDPVHREDPVRRFLDMRGPLNARLDAADGLDLGRIRMTSPFFSFMRFDLGSAFRMIAAHERRHLWQARQVREEEGFPRT